MKKTIITSLLTFVAALVVSTSAAPTVSNVRFAVTSTTKVGNLWNWNFSVTYDLANTNGKTCRVWPGVKVGDKGYWMYWNLAGDTATAAGTNKVITFMVKDTGTLAGCRVKVTAWDRDSWPPLPNKPFFQKYMHWEMDVRGMKKFVQSDIIMNYMKTTMESYNGVEIVGTMTFCMPIFRVMGNHAMDNGYPIPLVSAGDPMDAYHEGGAIACQGDDHMSILDVEKWTFYDFYQFCRPGGTGAWQATGKLTYDMTMAKYVWTSSTIASLYPQGQTNVDAAGLQIAPGCLRLDDVAEGEITTALRFTAGLNLLGAITYYPAVLHDGDAPGAACIMEGMRMRLKPDIDINTRFPLHGAVGSNTYKASQVAQMIARGLQKYGMICADRQTSNNFLLSAEIDKHTELKWADYGGPEILNSFLYHLPSCLEFDVVDPATQFTSYKNYAALLP